MSSMLIWFSGVIICGIGISIIIGGLSILKEAVLQMFEEKDFGGFIYFIIVGLFVVLIGVAIFFGGYMAFKSVL